MFPTCQEIRAQRHPLIKLKEQAEQVSHPAPLTGHELPFCTGKPKMNLQRMSEQEPARLDLVSEAELAKELFELTVEERARVLDDVHGVADVRIETPEFVEACLQELDQVISELPKSKRRAINLAVSLKPNTLKDVKFRLSFLRAEQYDASKAAGRMERHFLWKLELFGDAYIAKKITLDDLDARCIKVLTEGPMVEFPNSDQTGRSIWFFDLAKFDWTDSISVLRCLWYLMTSSAIGNDIAEIKGVCHVHQISMAPQKNLLPNYREILLKIGDLVESLPIRTSSIHSCIQVPENWLDIFAGLIRQAAGKQGRLRLRIHVGSDTELKYSLGTFGIDFRKVLDAGNDNDNKKEKGDKQHKLARQYISRRRDIERAEKEAEEREEAKTGVILCPKLTDVLMKRGRPFRIFQGTRRWNRLIEDRLERYQACQDRFGKTCLSIEVVKLVHEYGGRFMHRTGAGWEILDDAVAREKTLRAFRPRIMRNNSNTIDPEDSSGPEFDEAEGRPAKRMKL